MQSQTRPDEIKVTYKAVDEKLDDILIALSDIGDINIAFSSELIPVTETFTIYALNKSIGGILNDILNDTSLTYKLVGNQLVIIKDEYKFAPEFLTISGKIVDRESGEPLPYASIYLYDRSLGTEANEYGFFSLKLPNGLKRIYATYLGYDKSIKEIRLVKDTVITVGLKPQASLNEVLIVDRALDIPSEKISSTDRLPVDRIRSIAALGGEPDVLRLAHLSSGVTTGADGFGGLNVRGGSSDQNLMLLDGVPVYNTGHAFGLFSVYNPNIIKSAEILKGSMPARFGGRLSSIMDVRTKDGNLQKAAGNISVGVVALNATLEGPISKDASSYIVSFRRTIVDPFIKNITEYINDINARTGQASYYYYDFNGKINLKLNDKHRLIMSYYRGADVFGNNVTSTSSQGALTNEELKSDEWDGGNNVALLRLNSKLSQNLFAKTSVYFSNYDYNSFTYNRIIETDVNENIFYSAGLYESKIQDFGVKLDIDYIPNANHIVRTGIHAVRHDFSPGLITFNEGDQIVEGRDPVTKRIVEALLKEPQLTGNELSAYVEDEININEHFKVNVGVHANAIQTNSNVYTSIQPRAGLLYTWKKLFAKMGYSRTNQYLHLISNTGLGIPIDVWIPSSDQLKPEQANIYNAGLGVNIGNGYSLDVEGYFKQFENIVGIQEGAFLDINEGTDWQSAIPVGSGEAYGFEANISKTVGQSVWQANYTYSKSMRTFEELNGGRPFEFRFNRDHQFKFAFIRKINSNAEFSLNWLFGSGNPITAPIQLQPYIDNKGIQRLLPIYTEKNNQLLPEYHRLDIAFSFYGDFSWADKWRFTLGLYNAYNRKNPAYIDIQKDRDRPETFSLYQYSILPVLPTASFSISF